MEEHRGLDIGCMGTWQRQSKRGGTPAILLVQSVASILTTQAFACLEGCDKQMQASTF